MSNLKNLIRVSFAAMLAVGLAACGGGGTTMDPPDLGPARIAASDAAADAAMASEAAAAAVANVADNAGADTAAYVEASKAADAASAAAAAAAAASDAADDATTLAGAETAQATAEAEQVKAEAAQTQAEMYAQSVADAQQALDDAAAETERLAQEAAEAAAEAARMEAAALASARDAADDAADMAETAAYQAAAAVAGVEDISGSAQASYDSAQMAAQSAMAAATAARDASDAANRATTSADAQAQQTAAETAQQNAADALADAQMYAGMVTQAKSDADAEAESLAAETEAAQMLADTKQAAQDAADAAAAASRAANEAVEAQRANKDLSTIAAAAFARADDAALDAANASGDAAMANNAAQAATDQADADMYKAQAEAAQARAALAKANADSFAGMVADVKQAMDGAADETQMLTDAKTAAEAAATAARMAADDADAAAAATEAAAPGSATATNARAAATAAGTAADLAEAANVRAQDAGDSATAMMEQLEAENQRNIARSKLVTAETNQDSAEDARAAAERVQEERDLANAKTAAQDLFADAADGVVFHYEAVMMKAGLASGRATAAEASAARAARARTDSTTASAEAAKARAASNEAQASLARAMTAKGEADDALQDSEDAMTSDDAETALAALRAANAKLTEEHTGETGAGMDYMAAKDAAMAAADAARMHVLSLLKTANAYDVTSAITGLTLDETKQREVDSIGAEITAVASETAANRAGSDTTASSTWPADTADDPEVDGDQSMTGMLGITVNVAGATIEAAFEAVAADPDADPPVTAVVQTAKRIPGLDATFTHGFDIWEDDGNPEVTTDQARVIAFTNKQQGTPAVTEVTAVTARYVENEAVDTAAQLSLGTDTTGPTYTDATWTPPGQAPLTGTLSCSTEGCDIQVDADGNVTEVDGYVFTGSRAARAAVAEVAAMENNDYLVLGIWLDEDGGADDFGAFAVGGTGYAAEVQNEITGTATYRGSASGAHHITDGPVSYFDGRATLTADFGADSAPGTVKGTIDKIHVGGNPYGHSISLSTATLTDNTATFDGNAVMGPQKEPGSAEHLFNGTWDGSFYGASAAVADDPDTTADETVATGTRAPDGVAGTFGVSRSETMGTGATATTEVESFVGAYGAYK